MCVCLRGVPGVEDRVSRGREVKRIECTTRLLKQDDWWPEKKEEEEAEAPLVVQR